MKKPIAKVPAAILAALLVAACSGLNTRIENQMEAVGSELTGVPVTVDGVNLKILQGSGQITGLSVANPEGYRSQNAFDMDLLRLNLGVLSILFRTSPIVLDEVVIDSPVVSLEMNEQGGSNLKDISGNTQMNLKKADRKSAETEPVSADAPGEPHRIAIRRLTIEGVTFHMRRADGTTRSGTLPTIELTDVGGSKGRTPGGIGAVIVVAMSREVLKEMLMRKVVEKSEGFPSDATYGYGKVFDAETVIENWSRRLALSSEQKAKFREVVEKSIQDINDTIGDRVGQDFLDLETLSQRFEVVSETAREKLRNVLSSDQLRELQRRFTLLASEAVEKIREAFVDKLARLIGVGPDQIHQLRPILWGGLERRSALVKRFASDPDVSLQDLFNDFEALQVETLQELESVLDEDQLNTLAAYQESLRQMIRSVFAASGTL